MVSFKSVIKFIEIPQPEGQTFSESFLSNEDLLPVPEEHRTWKAWNYCSFWIADAFNLNTFSIASSMVLAGMSWWQSWLCVIIGYGIVGPFVVLNARPGAMFHMTFPAVTRTSFGLFGALWPVFNRGAMACIWWGVQAWLGGECVYVMLRAMAPQIENMHNSFSPGAGLTSKAFVGFFLFWLISLPTLWPPISKVRHLFTAKAILAPIAGFFFFGWTIKQAGGVGPIMSQPSTLSGSTLGWQMIISIMSCVSNMATLCVNAPDFGSRASKPSNVVWSQIIMIPLSFTITSFLGIVISSASKPLYGEAIWDVVQLLGKMLDPKDGVNPSGGTRFGVWFIAASFVYIQAMTNLSANSISAGCDLTALFPRFINIRRGSYVAALIGIVMCPWNLFASSSSFTNYLSAYSVFLSAIAGPMISEYWIVRRGHYRVADLYNYNDQAGWYRYTKGVNWRAYLAYFCGIAINITGFVGALGVGIEVPIAATRIYQLSWFTGVIVSGSVYCATSWFFPPPGAWQSFQEIDESDFVTPELHGKPVTHYEKDGNSFDGDEKKSRDAHSDEEVVVEVL